MNSVAIDTGGTKIVGAVVDEGGVILDKKRYEGFKRDGDTIISIYNEIISGYRGYDVCAVGVGAGGRIDVVNGRVSYAVDLFTNWVGREISRELSAHGLPVFVDNDCKMSLMGEAWKGKVSEYSSVFGLILGTGVGGGFLDNGRMHYGKTWGSGEAGHIILYPEGKKCLCGQNGCVEKYVSGTALWERYNDMIGSRAISSGYEFFALVKEGDESAGCCLRGFVCDLAVTLVNIGNLFDPDAFLLGGGLIDTKEYWWDSLMEQYDKIANRHIRKTPIEASVLGNDAALLGAARTAFTRLSMG